MIKMIKIEGFEMFGCPLTMVFLAHDIEDAKDLFHEKYPNAELDIFQDVVDKFGYEVSTTLVEVHQG